VSPTFNILKCYFEVQPNVFHIDAYRLEDQNIDIGLEEFLEGEGISFVEWPNFIEKILPRKTMTIKITRLSDNEREFELSSDSEMYKEVFDSLEGK
jgi:tRNA threonylcarbamoyladenosine biosynthesis protein TsaE